MTLVEALLLGSIQGVFMFFPVSSTSHLALAQHWLIARGSLIPAPESAAMIFFDLVVHVGTLLSIALVFRRSLRHFLRYAWRDVRGFIRSNAARQDSGQSSGIRPDMGSGIQASSESRLNWQAWRRRLEPFLYLRLLLLGLFSVFITGLIGFPLKNAFEHIFAEPFIMGINLSITGILLYWTDKIGARPKGLRQLSLQVALVIGIAQGLALMPGLSRSGLTIAFALFVGLRRRWAAEYSFFIAFPTILGATLLQALEVWRSGEGIVLSMASLTVGFVTAAVVGTAALYLVLHLLYRARFRYFSFYVWGLALLIWFGVVV